MAFPDLKLLSAPIFTPSDCRARLFIDPNDFSATFDQVDGHQPVCMGLEICRIGQVENIVDMYQRCQPGALQPRNCPQK